MGNWSSFVKMLDGAQTMYPRGLRHFFLPWLLQEGMFSLALAHPSNLGPALWHLLDGMQGNWMQRREIALQESACHWQV